MTAWLRTWMKDSFLLINAIINKYADNNQQTVEIQNDESSADFNKY